jgi:hypothetical protein
MRLLVKGVSGCLVGILILVGLIFVALLFLQGGVWLGQKVLPWLLRTAAVTLAVVVLVLLPLAAAWRTRRFAAKGLFYASGIFGMTLWIWGLILTYDLWGGAAVLVGLVLLGVGVVPMAMLATLFGAMWPTLGRLLLLAALTFGTRHLGTHLLAKLKAAEQKVYELEIV